MKTIEEFIAEQSTDRIPLLQVIHQIIIETDLTVIPVVGLMMGKEMIMYNDEGFFKYGLASVKEHMSLHVLPLYMVPALHEKYRTLFPAAKFQKGCINFKNETQVPPDLVKQLIVDCAAADLTALKAAFLKKRNKK